MYVGSTVAASSTQIFVHRRLKSHSLLQLSEREKRAKFNEWLIADKTGRFFDRTDEGQILTLFHFLIKLFRPFFASRKKTREFLISDAVFKVWGMPSFFFAQGFTPYQKTAKKVQKIINSELNFFCFSGHVR